MKTLIFILIFAFAFSVMGQSGCPTISVTGPSGITRVGDSMTFTANIVSSGTDKIGFEWTLSNGTIKNGQGTPTIILETNEAMAGQVVTATVKVSGLTQNCPNESFMSGEVDSTTKKFDCYFGDEWDRKLTWREEKEKLDAVANELKFDEKSKVYYLVQTNEKSYSQSIKARQARIKKYLFEKHKIEKNRVWVIYEGEGNYRTKVFLVPSDVPLPESLEKLIQKTSKQKKS